MLRPLYYIHNYSTCFERNYSNKVGNLFFKRTIRRKKQQTNIYLKKRVDGVNEKQFNTPRLQGTAKKKTYKAIN